MVHIKCPEYNKPQKALFKIKSIYLEEILYMHIYEHPEEYKTAH